MEKIIFVSSCEKNEVRLYDESVYENEGWNWEPLDYEYLEWVDDNDNEWDGGYCDAVTNAINKLALNNNIKWEIQEYSYEMATIIDVYNFNF